MTINQLIDELSNYHGNAGVQIVCSNSIGCTRTFKVKRVSTLPTRNVVFLVEGHGKDTVSQNELKILCRPKQPRT